MGYKSRLVKKILIHSTLFTLSILIAIPFIWMISTSFKNIEEVLSLPPTWIPKRWVFRNYLDAVRFVPLGRFFLNSVVVSSITVISQLTVCSMSAYAFSILKFKGRDILFFILLSTMAIPGEITLIPTFLLIRNIGWMNTYQGIVAPSLVSVFGIFLLRQFFMGIPKELEEAGRIDGITDFGLLIKIILPLSKPALATLSLFAFLDSWNSYMWPLIVTNRIEMRLVQVGLRYFINDELGNNWGGLMAISTLIIIPTLIVFLLSQRYFIEGIKTSGIRG
ncbi:MAG: carbohydrate ABC transporter permease [bacterium]|nr:carbohydrate ABC transporter permease [bacterium]